MWYTKSLFKEKASAQGIYQCINQIYQSTYHIWARFLVRFQDDSVKGNSE